MTFCQCGCGGKPKLAKQNDSKKGYIKGQPYRFIQGHAARKQFPSIHERYEVDTATGCWNWTGPIDRLGYGKHGVPRAHRLMYEALVGPIPKGLVIDHLCRNRRCCNPAHLEPVTQKVNMERSSIATKTHCLRGHEFTPENTRIGVSGSRFCRECCRIRSRESYARIKARSS